MTFCAFWWIALENKWMKEQEEEEEEEEKIKMY